MHLHGVRGESLTEITGSDTFFTAIASSVTTTWEACIQQAIDKINGYARDELLPSMTGSAESMTVTVPSTAAGFIRELTVAIYQRDISLKGSQSSSMNLLGVGDSQSSSSGGSSEIEQLAMNAAKCLKDIEASYG